ncbi:MAG: hypothetical protein WC052_00500 [Patescibacteria group bacterium]|jgi:hypothetical protein
MANTFSSVDEQLLAQNSDVGEQERAQQLRGLQSIARRQLASRAVKKGAGAAARSGAMGAAKAARTIWIIMAALATPEVLTVVIVLMLLVLFMNYALSIPVVGDILKWFL